MDKTTAIVVGTMSVVLMLVLGAVGIAVITSNDDQAPTPTVSTPAPVETSDPIRDLLEDTWNEQSASDQESLCWLFNLDADKAFDTFNSGAEGLVPEDTFMEFFYGECSTI
jgi:hypothetical protein